ncbi:MAG: hypothetical protein MJZ00_03515 [Paludibacteraceae bacterium]|nr:hypothetical protein [Paludibacteraceae bacterium]
MKNKYIKHFTLLASLVFGSTEVFAQDIDCSEFGDNFRESSAEFCEGNGEGAVEFTLRNGEAADYTIHWWYGEDTVGTSIGDDLTDKYFESKDINESGTYIYQIEDKETGCKGDTFHYQLTVYEIPEAPKDENLPYTKNSNSNEILSTDKFAQTLDATKKLVWYTSPDPDVEANTRGKSSVTFDRTRPTTTPYKFYIAYQDGDCYSERARVEVEVLAAPIPIVKDIEICQNGSFDLLDNVMNDAGFELIWFVDPTDTVGKALTTPPTNIVDVETPGKYTYYVAQRMKTAPYAQSDAVAFDVDIIAAPAPKINIDPVIYTKSEGETDGEFLDILNKYPTAIEEIPPHTLLWARSETGPFIAGNTLNSKPFYDASVARVEEIQERWVIWDIKTTSGLECLSEPSKITIKITSTPAPIVKEISICEDVFKNAAGSPIADLEPIDNASLNNDESLDVTDYKLYWFEDPKDADAAELDPTILSLGSTTAPSLAEVFADVDLTDNQATEWTKSLYVVQSDGITTSPASEMKITINATPKLVAYINEPACNFINLKEGNYWSVTNGVEVNAEYRFGGLNVTQNASQLTEPGEYIVVGTSSLGCISDPLPIQLDIRNLTITMDPKSVTCVGSNVNTEIAIEYDYNKDVAKPSLEWTSTEMISGMPTQKGVISADETKFIYESGNFEGVAGDIHTISITITDGYCTATADQKVTIGDGPVEGYFSWNEPNNMSATNGSTLMLSELSKDKVIINACGDAVTVDFSEVMRDSNSDIEWYSDPNFSKPIATGDSKTFNAKEYGKYYIRYPNGCYASASFEIVDASVEILTTSDGVLELNEKESYTKEIMVSSAVSPLSFAWYKDGEPFINNSDVLTFKSLNVANSGLYTIEYHSGACSAKLDVVDLKVIKLDNAVISISANDPDEIINVYTITGALVKSNVKRSEALNGLANGIYMIGGDKVIVNK